LSAMSLLKRGRAKAAQRRAPAGRAQLIGMAAEPLTGTGREPGVSPP